MNQIRRHKLLQTCLTLNCLSYGTLLNTQTLSNNHVDTTGTLQGEQSALFLTVIPLPLVIKISVWSICLGGCFTQVYTVHSVQITAEWTAQWTVAIFNGGVVIKMFYFFWPGICLGFCCCSSKNINLLLRVPT